MRTERAEKEIGMKIYVGNISKETTELQLRESFEKFGAVSTASIELDKKNGKSSGSAFVEMSSDKDTQTAINGVNLRKLSGSSLRVREAKKK
jgi:RNA recognition motif-containing protein